MQSSILDSHLKCDCGENCFYYLEIRQKKNDSSKIENVVVNKCNRIIEEGSRKIPCKFYNEKIIKEKDYIKTEIELYEKIKKDTVVTYKDIRDIINKMLENYYVRCTNYFGKLNKYLHILGYEAHDPPTESLSELKYRLSKKPIKKKNIIYNYSRDQQLTQNIGEYDFDYDEESSMLDRVEQKIDPLEWTKNDIVQFYLKRPKVNKNLKSKKRKTVIKEDLGEIEEEEQEEQEEQGEENDEDSEEEDNKDNDKDNEFDIEQESDDDDNYDDNNDYDDFSD